MAKRAIKRRKTLTEKRYEQAQNALESAEKLVNQLENEGYKVSTVTKDWLAHFKKTKRYTADTFKQMQHYTRENNIRRLAKKTLLFDQAHTDKKLRMRVSAYKTNEQITKNIYNYVKKEIKTPTGSLGVESKRRAVIRNFLQQLQQMDTTHSKQLYEGRKAKDVDDYTERFKKQTKNLTAKNFRDLVKTMEEFAPGSWEMQYEDLLKEGMFTKEARQGAQTIMTNKMRNTFLGNYKVKLTDDKGKPILGPNNIQQERNLTDMELDVIYEFFKDPVWQMYRKDNAGKYKLDDMINNAIASKKNGSFTDNDMMDEFVKTINKTTKANMGKSFKKLRKMVLEKGYQLPAGL